MGGELKKSIRKSEKGHKNTNPQKHVGANLNRKALESKRKSARIKIENTGIAQKSTRIEKQKGTRI